MKLNLIFLFIIVFFSELVTGQEIIDYKLQYNTDKHNYLVPWNKEFQETENRSRYRIPRSAYSIDAGDIDLDGDMDIVIGHNYNSLVQWGGVTIMLNDGFGYFELYDSVFLFGWQPDVKIENMNNESLLEIIAKKEDHENENELIAIINDFDLDDISYYTLNTFEGVDHKTSGDVNGDGNTDILVTSNGGQFWGVLYNNEYGQLSQPVYRNIYGYFPTDISCSDLNGDNRDDIAICGQSTEVFFSYPEGFESLLLEDSDAKEKIFITDFDWDGDNDLITFHGIYLINISLLKMFKNQGDGTFDTIGEFYFQGLSSGSFLSDFNNDSLPDALFVLSDYSGLVVFYNQGNFQLDDSTFISLPGYQNEGLRRCSCADFDGNGFNDIAIIRGASIELPDNLVILFNDGEGNFGEDPCVGIDDLNENIQVCSLNPHPNPFVSRITFKVDFNRERQANAFLKIYDMNGNLVKNWNLTRDFSLETNLISWDGTSMTGACCPPGIYIASFEVNNTINQQIKIIKLD